MSENKSHATEKQFLKSEIDMKAFMRDYISSRFEYHKYQILKVKIG